MAARKEKSGKRERRFNDAEKCDLVDIICNEETTNADGDQDEPVLVKLGQKPYLTRRKHPFIDQLLTNLQGEDMKSGIPKGLNACGTYYSVTIFGLKTC